jgi:hypothetical protein
MLPAVDPMNRARLIEWAQDNLNEMPNMFQSHLDMDIDDLKDYEPPTPMEELKEPSPRD